MPIKSLLGHRSQAPPEVEDHHYNDFNDHEDLQYYVNHDYSEHFEDHGEEMKGLPKVFLYAKVEMIVAGATYLRATRQGVQRLSGSISRGVCRQGGDCLPEGVRGEDHVHLQGAGGAPDRSSRHEPVHPVLSRDRGRSRPVARRPAV